MDGLKKLMFLIIGWSFLILGIFGLFLPFLQGILFIMIGLAILSSQSKRIRDLLKKMEKRYPHLHQRVEVWKEKIRHWYKKETS
jgi:uncharacterized membrane protein YbaN (DUF454 family)